MQTQPYKHRSNARRAARAAGVDPELVTGDNAAGFTFPAATNGTGADVESQDSGGDFPELPEGLARPKPTEEERETLATKARKRYGPDREIRMPEKRSQKPKAERSKGKDKTAEVIRLMSRKNGATVKEMTGATDWLPHTLRARISRLCKAKKDGGEGLKIKRQRVEGETSYWIES